MPLTDLDICNLAIDAVGGDRIADFDEETPLAGWCRVNWPTKRDYLLGLHRWAFATRVRLLAQIEPAPDEARPMEYKFERPADQVGAVHAFRDEADVRQARLTPYVMLVDGHFWSDEARLFAEYTARPREAEWPGWFVELVRVALTADLAGHCQMRTLQREQDYRAFGAPSENGRGGLFEQAMVADGREAPQRTLIRAGVDDGPLVEARYGNGRDSGFVIEL